MKKLSILLALLLMPLLCLVSCGSDKDEPQNDAQKVEVSLSYTFAESGSMTRSIGSDAYDKFYNALIKTKTLTPKHYSLTFTEKGTGTKYVYNGQWDNGGKINILEGNYTVTGTSAPITQTVDTLYMSFKEDINITKNTSTINLTAINDSYLLLFNAEPYKSITYMYSSNTNEHIKLKSKEGVYYMYVRELIGGYYGYGELEIKANNGDTEKLYIKNTPFQKGKYYYFNELTNSFEVPPMTEGN